MVSGRFNQTQASVRHLVDARVLLDSSRPDGAVHLAGFAAECAIKAKIQALFPDFPVKEVGHDVERLDGRESTWAAAASGDRDLQRMAISVSGSQLANGHPDRRYWENHWSEPVAAAIVEQAEELVVNRVIRPWLDQGLTLDLG